MSHGRAVIALLNRCLLGLSALSAPAQVDASVQLLLNLGSANGSFESDHLTPSMLDADGDGRAEVCYETTGPTISFFARHLDGTLVGQYDLPPLAVLCPSCGAGWIYNCCGSLSFGNVDPLPGREAVVSWQFYGPGAESVEGITIFSAAGTPIQTIPGLRLTSTYDFDGDGTDELILNSITELQIWGQQATADVSEMPVSSLSTWPNPTSRSTRFEFDLPAAGSGVARIYDVAGRRVSTESRQLVSGSNAVRVTPPRASGVYFVVVEAGGFSTRGRFLVLR